MSASWDKKVIKLPHLPPEIWSRIFQHATLVPGIFDVKIEDPFGPSSPGAITMYDHGTSEKRAIRASLVTKRYLVRVCKQWHALGMPFLYESIYIGWWHVLPSLRDVLLESERRSCDDPDGRPALGWWTRRLDVAIRTANTDVEKGFLNSPGYHALVDIIHCLPRLETFSSRWMPDFLEVGLADGAPSPIAEALKQACCASLRRIFWPDVSGRPEPIDGLLAASPSLVTLSHFDNPVRCPLSMPFPPTLEYLSLPNCAKFHVDPPGPPNLTLPCPSLRQISLHDYEQSDLICLHHFLGVQGSTVSTVYIYMKDFRGTLRPTINILNHHCPNIQHLIIVFRKWMRFPDSTRFRAVTHLGLYLPDQGCTDDYRVVFRWLGCISSSTLKVIRFMNPRGFVDLRDRHRGAFEDVYMMCCRRGLRLEGPDGQDPGLITPGSVGQGSSNIASNTDAQSALDHEAFGLQLEHVF